MRKQVLDANVLDRLNASGDMIKIRLLWRFANSMLRDNPCICAFFAVGPNM